MKQDLIWTESTLLRAIKGTEERRREAFDYLYNQSGWRAWVLRHVAQNGGDQMNGEDVFQEAVILLDRNIREEKFEGNSTLETYFMGIAKQFWFNRRRSIKNFIEFGPAHYDGQQQSPEADFIEQEKIKIINQILDELGDPCKEVLKLYKLSMSNQEIADQLGFSSPELAKKYTYRCRKRFREYVLAHEYLKSLLGIGS